MKVNIEKLDKRSRTPVLTYCRKLISTGTDPNETLEVYKKDPQTGQNHLEWDIRVNNIGEVAKLTVQETVEVGPVFAKYDSRGFGSRLNKYSKIRSTSV